MPGKVIKVEKVIVLSLNGSAAVRFSANALGVTGFNVKARGAEVFVGNVNPKTTKLYGDGTTNPSAAGRITEANCNFVCADGENVPRHAKATDEASRDQYDLNYWFVDAAAACKVYINYDDNETIS